MIRKLVPLLALAALAGCSDVKSPAGVWLISLGYLDPAEGARTVTHNYLNAIPEKDEIEDPYWTHEETYESSDGLLFAEIFEYDQVDAEYLMVTNLFGFLDVVLPGTEQADGTFLFTWTNFEHSSDKDTHASGYDFTFVEENDLTWSVSLDLAEPVATGAFEIATVSTRDYSETDLWDYMVVGEWGRTPAENYLDSTLPGGTVQNSAMVNDCTTSPCLLTSVYEGLFTGDLTATRTSVREGDYESVETAYQPPGIPEEGPF